MKLVADNDFAQELEWETWRCLCAAWDCSVSQDGNCEQKWGRRQAGLGESGGQWSGQTECRKRSRRKERY